jgi:predicted 3-demethylubiquinone-9 3-methyltransferase (glyoxalase superfamily)
MAKSIQPFLMFQGNAREAIDFYVLLFSGAEVLDMDYYGPNEAGAEGSIKKARFSVGGQIILCIDSATKHGFSLTPAFSLFVECESEEEIGRLYSELAAGGAVFMPIGSHGFSRKFAWVSDRFGLSWQLNLA